MAAADDALTPITPAISVTTSTADDEVFEAENRSLGRDFLALTAIFLIIATFHIQNPLLQFETQFGKSFRNDGLQIVLTLGMFAAFALMIRTAIAPQPPAPSPMQAGRRGDNLPSKSATDNSGANSPSPRLRGRGVGVRGIAIIILIVYAVFTGLAILLDWNPMAALFGIEPLIFLDQLEDTVPAAVLAGLQSALGLAMLLEFAAVAAVIVLWQPWTRFGVYRKAARRQLAAIIVGVVVLILWEALISVFQIQQFLLPRPSVIAETFIETYPRLVSAGWITFQNAFWGFVLGCGLGILTGMIAARFISFSRALLPIAIAINAIPIIALAPIFNNWFGALNPFSKVAVIAVLTYFPAMISTVRGLTTVDPLSLELMRSYAAPQFDVFRKARLPNALPYILSALKVATTLAMIGAIVSEYFGGSTAGLGFKIRDDAGLFKYPEAWASILMASLFGILFYLVVSAVERALLHWHVSFREK